jgi:hypothetical protein
MPTKNRMEGGLFCCFTTVHRERNVFIHECVTSKNASQPVEVINFIYIFKSVLNFLLGTHREIWEP